MPFSNESESKMYGERKACSMITLWVITLAEERKAERERYAFLHYTHVEEHISDDYYAMYVHICVYTVVHHRH